MWPVQMVTAWAGPLPPCVPRVFLIPAASQGYRKWGQEHFRVCAGRLGLEVGSCQGENRALSGPWCSRPCPFPTRETQDGFVADSPPRLFFLEVASHCTQDVQPERGRPEKRAESFLKGNAVVVLRCSLHICGWRFPGFSEVNAGSA